VNGFLIDAVLLAVLVALGIRSEVRHLQASLRRDPALTRRLVRRGVLFGAGGILTMVAVLPALPWAMGIVTEAQHVYIDEVPDANRGAYLDTDDGVMQLFTWRVDPGEFPSDAPTLQADAIQQVAIVQKRFDPVDEHVLREVDEGRPVAWADAAQDGTVLRLTPDGPLPAGRYKLRVPTDSMYGGVTTHYFIVEDRDA
jgi:hypothetical protein